MGYSNGMGSFATCLEHLVSKIVQLSDLSIPFLIIPELNEERGLTQKYISDIWVSVLWKSELDRLQPVKLRS